MAKKDKNQSSQETAANEDPLAAVSVAAPEQAAAPAPAVEAPKIKQYRVKATKLVSLRGQMTHLAEGQIISLHTHGPDGMESIKNAGVQLEEI